MKRTVLTVLAILLSWLLLGQCFAQNKKEQPAKRPMHSASNNQSSAQDKEELLGPDKWPTTVKATVTDILSKLSEKNKEAIRETKKDNLSKFHFGVGTWIRNYYGLWRGNKALREDACGMECHPDNASGVIIQAVWEALQHQGNSE